MCIYMYNLHCIPNVFPHANVVNISKRVYEIFESFVIKFNNTSRASVIHFVSGNERKKKEADAGDRQLVRACRREREKERKKIVQRILFSFISSNFNSILVYVLFHYYFAFFPHSYKSSHSRITV